MSVMWKVHVDTDDRDWEVSVCRSTNNHGLASWGWMDDEKLLVGVSDCMSGHAIEWVYHEHVKLAKKLCKKLNAGEDIDLSWANGPEEEDDDEDDWEDDWAERTETETED